MRRRNLTETWLVLGVSLGASAVWSLLRIVDKLTRAEALGSQTTAMNSSVTPDRPWLDLAYQPIVRLSDGVIAGVEALIRLPAQGSLAGLADLVTPAELVEVAEGTGEIDELGRWVLAEATHQAAPSPSAKFSVSPSSA